MIRPPLQACRERKWETSAVSFAVVVVIAIPLALALFALCAQSAAADWLQTYTPVVYLEPDVNAEQAGALATEIEQWPLVKAAEVRSPEGAHAALTKRLGDHVVTELGVTAGMLPRSIVIQPSLPLAGHIDLVSRVSGLQARTEVDAVEVPSSDALQIVTIAAVGLGVAALTALFGLFASLILLLSYLKRLRETDSESDRVLALFGAYNGELRRPTYVRGVAVSAVCGVVVTVLGAISLLAWQAWSPQLIGTALSPPTLAWSVVGSPILLVPVLGFAAAWLASRQPVQIWGGSHG